MKYHRCLPVPGLLLVALVSIVLIGGCSKRTAVAPGDDTQRIRISHTMNAFAEYEEVPVSYTPRATMEPVAPDLSNVINYRADMFAPGEEELLKANLFVARTGYHLRTYEIYEPKALPAFVSSDAVLHAFHQVFSASLIQSEGRFGSDLTELTDELYARSLSMEKSLDDKAFKDAARRNTAYFGVARALLGEPVQSNSLIKKELALIDRHNGYAQSPIFGYEEDYSHFVPRGHYTRSDRLTKYFKAMMWYGRMNFHLASAQRDPVMVRRHTRQAILITHVLQTAKVPGPAGQNQPALAVWQRIYEPTAFFSGYADDLTVRDYVSIMQRVYGAHPSLEKLADDTLLKRFIQEARELRKPKISSTGAGTSPADEMGFRFMGSRFVPDSFIFQELVIPKTSRSMPDGLDIPATLGSERALEILGTLDGKPKDKPYAKQMAALRREFSSYDRAIWTQNLYWGWLDALRTLLGPRGEGYPPFMRTKAWEDKSLSTFLGSWAELRHDTILYVKQSTTLGMMMPQEPLNAYVEPNPELYAKLLALTHMLREGLATRELMENDSELSARIDALAILLERCRSVSEKELSGTRISKEENVYFKEIDKVLSQFYMPLEEAEQPMPGMWDEDRDEIIADVHTDPITGQCLEVGVGMPLTIFVIAPDNGRPALFIGAAYSYYEFAQPLSERLTDETWRNIVGSPERPPRPKWVRSFMADTNPLFD